MAPKRRSTGNTKQAQSTLAFHGQSTKVTKPTSTPTSSKTKKTKQDPALAESIVRTNLPAVASPDLEEPTTAEIAIIDQAEQEAAQEETAEEKKARKVTDAQIKKYWKAKESVRNAPRVHQKELSVEEKVLREWDTSGQYGPCIGIARMKRWKRAHRLGLQPPMEVLAILLKEQDRNNIKAQRAHIDELMSSRFVET
ncbi:hypothetical protein K402DRAFT_369858 [Aulographum hederae CBS 113979]|uniref:DNA polymerase delta subunit 4 n=1 Tax=Aulographum hederae CBS 113979 TaxID=1176131 RepID=A0A6G1HCR7_9PEZI|nr:hypothetical protein K402DRAFT_369858 [Aulographum hederae CBS 113979]